MKCEPVPAFAADCLCVIEAVSNEGVSPESMRVTTIQDRTRPGSHVSLRVPHMAPSSCVEAFFYRGGFVEPVRVATAQQGLDAHLAPPDACRVSGGL